LPTQLKGKMQFHQCPFRCHLGVDSGECVDSILKLIYVYDLAWSSKLKSTTSTAEEKRPPCLSGIAKDSVMT
jgi:hypothetical protein